MFLFISTRCWHYLDFADEGRETQIRNSSLWYMWNRGELSTDDGSAHSWTETHQKDETERSTFYEKWNPNSRIYSIVSVDRYEQFHIHPYRDPSNSTSDREQFPPFFEFNQISTTFVRKRTKCPSVAEWIGQSKQGLFWRTKKPKVSNGYLKVTAQYDLVKESGPPHCKQFQVLLTLANETYTGTGTSIKRAHQGGQ